MLRSNMFRAVLFLPALFFSIAARAQSPVEEIAPLPAQLSQEKVTALLSLSPSVASQQAASPRRPHRYFFRKLRHALTPTDVALRESVRSLGTDDHRFVRCELKDHSVVTGAITFIGDERFFVRTGILGDGRSIFYRELSVPPRPVPAVGAHLKNGLEWTGLVALAIPVAAVMLPLFLTGVVQD